MVEGHLIFNAFVYAAVIAYILYINFAAYYNSGTNFLNFLVKLFNNWVFRLFYLLIIGFFAMDLLRYGGFTFAILLTIAFLNTNMLMYKKEVSESFTEYMTNMEEEEYLPTKFNNEYMDNTPEVVESMANMIDAESPENCGPYAPIQRLPFNPQGYRPDETVMGSGVPDVLPQGPLENGPYTQSGVAYEFDMA